MDRNKWIFKESAYGDSLITVHANVAIAKLNAEACIWLG